MQLTAKCLPITWTLEAMRLAVFQGHTIADLWVPLSVLAAMSVVLLPTRLLTFSLAIEKSERDGSLV